VVKRAPARPRKPAAAERVRFFATQAAWRRWLEANHDKADEIWVGLYKKSSGRPSITWPEAVDVALCFGWIDGVRKGIDEISYRNRFTPRRPGSNWSDVNVCRVEALTADGLMTPPGTRAFEARLARRPGTYSYEQRHEAALSPADEARFRANRTAWTYFESRPPSYRRTAIWWVVSAKQEATRQRRLAALIEDSAAGRLIGPMRRQPAT
jgi:uncharacterized protein YdeI (YjbR/CyaY-like superfamily)